jgi:hypothetical protein
MNSSGVLRSAPWFMAGPEYRELMEALHVLKHVAHQAKELFEEMVDEDDKGEKRRRR